jgi:hypothetical protein
VEILQALDTNSTSSLPNADEESEDKRLPEEPCCPPASLRNGTAEEPGAGPEPAYSLFFGKHNLSIKKHP